MTIKTDMIIDQIEAARRNNNSNWMEILRIAMKHAPAETKAVLRQIEAQDRYISANLYDLTEGCQ